MNASNDPSDDLASESNWERRNPIVEVDKEWLNDFLTSSLGKVEIRRTTAVGGLVNSNFRLDTDIGKYFLRVVSAAPVGAAKEISLLHHIESETSVSIPVPRTIASSEFVNQRSQRFPVVLQEWIDGQTLKSALAAADKQQVMTLGKSVGKVVAKFNRLPYEGTGFLDEHANIVRPFIMDAKGYCEYLFSALCHCGAMLEPELIEDVLRFANENSPALDHLPGAPSLTHGDFHPNNILVRRGGSDFEVVGIVDWESALAWTPLQDMSHLLRRPLREHNLFESCLLEGYRSGGGDLGSDWASFRGLFQLLSWVDKMAGGETRESVIESARRGLRRITATT